MKIRVWDLPTRLFHWALVICIAGAFITIKIGGNAVEYHFWFGYATLTLLLFRLSWGLVGGFYSRFLNFPLRPRYVLAYLRGQSAELPLQAKIGHNPLGSLSVLGLLSVLLFQTISGLFTNDDIASEGPLVIWITKDLSDLISGLHKSNEIIILSLVGLHILAILFYTHFKRERLVPAMLTGDKTLETNESVPTSIDSYVKRILAGLLFAAAISIVYWLINLKPVAP